MTLSSGRIAGEVRSAGGDGFTAGNVTFVQVYEAGYVMLISICFLVIKLFPFSHMVPFDPSEAALVSYSALKSLRSR